MMVTSITITMHRTIIIIIGAPNLSSSSDVDAGKKVTSCNYAYMTEFKNKIALYTVATKTLLSSDFFLSPLSIYVLFNNNNSYRNYNRQCLFYKAPTLGGKLI